MWVSITNNNFTCNGILSSYNHYTGVNNSGCNIIDDLSIMKTINNTNKRIDILLVKWHRMCSEENI